MNQIISKLAVLRESKAPFEHRDRALPLPRDGELIVEVDMCTICGSDLHSIEGRRPLAGPTVLGHEIIGHVVAIADNGVVDVTGTDLQIGDRITWSLHACCGKCFWCTHQLSPKCEQLMKYGHEPFSEEYPCTGGFASHCQIRAGTAIVRLPHSMPDRVACPANCATATVSAAFRRVGDCHGSTVLIFGAGMLGLTASAMARENGAAAVVMVDPDTRRAKLAENFGATFATADPGSAERQLATVTESRGADIAFDFSGHPQAVLACIQSLRIGGQAVLVGSVFPSKSVLVSPEMIVRRWLSISGVHNYTAEDLVTAVEFLHRVASKYPFETLVSPVFDLSDIDQAVRCATTGETVRVAIRGSCSA